MTVLGGCALTSPGGHLDERLTLCELRDSGEVYIGRSVVVQGIYETDRIEISFLADPSCRGIVISPYFSESSGSASIRAFNTAVVGDVRDLSARRFRVEMRGVFGAVEKGGARRFDVTEVVSYERLSTPS